MHKLEKSAQSILGLDEVGRGPLAGPVVMCGAFINPSQHDIKFLKKLKIKDSKQISEERRQEICKLLGLPLKIIPMQKYDFEWGSFILNEKSHKRIDEINILAATMEGMKEIFLSYAQSEKPETTLVDGNRVFKFADHDPILEFLSTRKLVPIVKGDSLCLSIGLASIIAKEYRDSLMKQMHLIYPQYGFNSHVGYPTQKHREALRVHGPCPIHRKSFKWQ